MPALKRAPLFGFLVWLIPFAVAVMIFQVRETNRPLFESIMPVTLAATAGFLAVRFFRNVPVDPGAGLRLGLIWMAMSLLIDAPLMLLAGPMQMTLAQYAADIGLTYLAIPAVTTSVGPVLSRSREP